MFLIRKMKLTYTQIIVLGTFLIILLGSILLSLPVSSKSGIGTPFLDSMFTAASSFCVTGLVLFDTYTHWSVFGQLIILALIQIGGLGFMTIITLISIFLKRKIGIRERRLIMESANTLKIGGVVRLVKKILIKTFIFEGIGTIILTIKFIPEMGLKEGFYYGLFHSISAFCNAGFDIMGKFGKFSSLTTYYDDYVVNFTIMALIIIGGIGFIVWDDIEKNHLQFKQYMLHTKIVLTITAILILSGTILFYVMEEKNVSMANMNFSEKLMASMFQSITPRTAGFNTINMTDLSEGSKLLTMILMMIGGSPGSTAGGIKTTTFVILLICALSSVNSKSELSIYKRRLENDALKKASSITVIYMITIFAASIIICASEKFSLTDTLFEVFSALGTVGLSMGITPFLSSTSKIVVIILMYGGKVGVLSLAAAIGEKKESVPLTRPVGKIIIG